jgi:hypothetical protein
MSIPVDQLETWSHQGSVTQSGETYRQIKGVLEAAETPYADKDFKVFLQGSYGNDTNIYAESDVDIVIRLDSTYYRDLSRMGDHEQNLYKSKATPSTYSYNEFKAAVVEVLRDQYGSDVTVGDKAIQIAARGNRRKADVIVALQHRRYLAFQSFSEQSYVEGIEFWTVSGVQIINYPMQHSQNLTDKHKLTNEWLKPVIRIFKNMRGKLIEKRLIHPDTAPSYYIEGLLYNVPADQFGTTYTNSVVNSINWVWGADRSKFLCVNKQYFLCHPTSPVTWRDEKRDLFIEGAVQLWNNW